MKMVFLASAASIHSYRWIRYFVDRGHEVTWISLAPIAQEFVDLTYSLDFYEIKPSPLADVNGWKSFLFLLPTVWKLRRILKRVKPQIFHVHSVGTYGLVGVLSGFKPLILTPWGSDILLGGKIKKFLIAKTVGEADYFTADGENTFQKMLDYGLDANKGRLIRYGVDINLFNFKNYSLSTSQKIVILSLRSLEPVYDIDNILEAAVILKTKGYENIKFKIAGGGTLFETLKDKAHKLGLDNMVELIGKYKHEDLANLLSYSDLYISTSLSDGGLAVSNAEAMAFKLPVILTDSGDNNLWLEEGIGGFLIPPRQPLILAEKILEAVNRKEEWEAWGERNFKLVNENYNYQKELEKAEDFYNRIVSNDGNETSKVEDFYASREKYETGNNYKYAWNSRNDISVFCRQNLERKIIKAFNKINFDLREKRILDVRCGDGNILRFLINIGAKPNNCFGIDLMENRIKKAKEYNEQINFIQVRANELPFPENYFDLVIQSTCFSSIFEENERKSVAEEMCKVLKDDGLLLWQDMRFNWKKNVCPFSISKRKVKEYFHKSSIIYETYLFSLAYSYLLKVSYIFACLAEYLPSFCKSNYLCLLKIKK